MIFKGMPIILMSVLVLNACNFQVKVGPNPGSPMAANFDAESIELKASAQEIDEIAILAHTDQFELVKSKLPAESADLIFKVDLLAEKDQPAHPGSNSRILELGKNSSVEQSGKVMLLKVDTKEKKQGMLYSCNKTTKSFNGAKTVRVNGLCIEKVTVFVPEGKVLKLSLNGKDLGSKTEN